MSILCIDLTSVFCVLQMVLFGVLPILVLRLLSLFLVFISVCLVHLNLLESFLKVSNELWVLSVPVNNFLDVALFDRNLVINYWLDLVVIFLHYIFIP